MPPIDSSGAMLALWAVLGYGLGSIPFGIVLAWMMGLGDLRKIGSGNIGATNVLRTGNRGAAALTLLLDASKGAVAVLLARALTGEAAAQLAGLAAILGHCHPVWLRFRGGKGVATFLGLMLALSWPVGVAACATWAITAAAARISSLAALMAAALSSIWAVVLGQGEVFFLTVALTLLIFWKHRENISRLRKGTEPRIGAK
ncbi:MAG: glycerol-3-phosphate 1-O-acyltransferase PlsY [Sediminimonas qiaohouensis]|uniref:Glycerol-3-phosphate acyltransferase n=1 Tax=Sediminimonas qiaohouensis TaxID=552061 RepID=A0A7C9H9U5_9RHOB|nr:glycerol-3-phosphate 1-O-acyltransferase PlsY [Sediminimonas qiaohouensis]MTJ03706.1 glycerol-3-phosphate 1-O-acyltransferase PlsY [Sediminimonas qiaohouensis]